MTERQEENECEGRDKQPSDPQAAELACSALADTATRRLDQQNEREGGDIAQSAEQLLENFIERLYAVLERFPGGTHRRKLFYELFGYNMNDASLEVKDAFNLTINTLIDSGKILQYKKREGGPGLISLLADSDDKREVSPGRQKPRISRPAAKKKEQLTIPPTFKEDVIALLDFQRGELHLNDLRMLFPNYKFPESNSNRAPYVVLLNEMKKLVDEGLVVFKGGGRYVTPAIAHRETYLSGRQTDQGQQSRTPRSHSYLSGMLKDAGISNAREERPQRRKRKN